MAEQINVRGLKKLNRALEQLPNNLKKKAVRRAVAAGAKLVQKEAKRLAPKGKSGALRRAIAVRGTPSRSQPNLIRSSIFVRTKGSKLTKAQKKRGDDPYYWYMQEFGFRAVGRRKQTGKGRRAREKFRGQGKKIDGRRFMTRAFDRKVGRAIVTFKRVLQKELNQYDGR